MKSLKFDFQRIAKRITYVNVLCNFILSAVKLAVGIIAKSSALTSDSINSITDVLSAVIVIIGLKIAGKESDKDHPYGHERFECVAAIVLSVFIFVTGIFMGHTAIERITAADETDLIKPGTLAMVVAIFSMVLKEVMYWYTRHYARMLDSSSLMGIAWDNRSDVFSTFCVLVGVIGSRLGIEILDDVASLLVCVFIIKASVNIFIDAIAKMVDSACPKETEEAIKRTALKQEGVLGVDLLQTRIFANRIYVDIEILVSPDITVVEGHSIAEAVHDAIEDKFTNVKHIMVHINPDLSDQ